MDDLKAARALGWASLAIAASEMLGHKVVETELLGLDDHATLMGALGVREAIAGATILSQHAITPTLAAGLWSRVAGDAMDLALMAKGAPNTRNKPGYTAATLMVAGITALDVYYAIKIQKQVSGR